MDIKDDFQTSYDDKKKTEKVNTPASNLISHKAKLCYKLKNSKKLKQFRLHFVAFLQKCHAAFPKKARMWREN